MLDFDFIDKIWSNEAYIRNSPSAIKMLFNISLESIDSDLIEFYKVPEEFYKDSGISLIKNHEAYRDKIQIILNKIEIQEQELNVH